MGAIVVIADDLSGAAELAGIALGRGLRVEVQTTFEPATEADIVCVDTDTRSLPAAQAAERVGEVTRQIVDAGAAWIFKKCDSVLRGSVLAEARATAAAAGKSRLVILPANPSRGRVIRGGNYFVNGQLLHETIFARDPEHPCSTANVAELLGSDLAGVHAPDAESGDDIARAAVEIDGDTLAVGAADFFRTLLERRTTSRSPATKTSPQNARRGASLLACGSAAAWTERRAEALERGIPVFALPHDVNAASASVRAASRGLIGIGNGDATRGMRPAELTTVLARSVAGILREANVARLLLEGGATAAAVVRAMGWTRLRAIEVSSSGVGVLRPVGADAPTLFVKPGSYSWPPEIWPLAVTAAD